MGRREGQHWARRSLRRLRGIGPEADSEGRFRRLEMLGTANGAIFLGVVALLVLSLLRSPSAALLAAVGILLVCGILALLLRYRFWGFLESELKRRKRAEQEARAADRAKGQLLAHVSHEMRTPMHGVLGMADLLLGGELTPAQREQVEIIRTSSEALLALVNDILDLSRIEAGRLVLRRQDFGLRELVEEVVRLFGRQAAEHEIDLRFRIAGELPERLQGDPVRLRQVLINLVGNAIRFTRRGHVAIEITRLGEAGAEASLRCTVQDTGVGIRPEVQARLFQPYAQSGSDGSLARGLGGTGLGLVISKSIVEQMGGRMGFESARGVGSTFWFEVPLALDRAAAAVPHEGGALHEGEAPRPGPHGRRILVVDDHPVNRRVALAQLASLGYVAEAADSGEAALALLAGESCDAVLLDCEMPQLDGYETCRRLRELEGGDRHTVVIAVTAHALAGEKERCLAAGMDDFLTKPVRPEELAAVLERWLAGKALGVAAPGRGAERLEESLAALDRLGEKTGEEVRRQVVEAFLQQGARDLAAMRQALARGDGAALAAAAHSLAGSAAILGATELAAGCAGLEALAREEDRMALAAWLEAVQQEYCAVAARLSA